MRFESLSQASRETQENERRKKLRKILQIIGGASLGIIVGAGIQVFHQTQEKPTKESAVKISPESMDKLTELHRHFGDSIAGLGRGIESKKQGEMSSQESVPQIRIEFERVGDLDQETISRLISEMPKNWGLGEIDSVSLEPESEKTDEGRYPIATFDGNTGKIVFYEDIASQIGDVEYLRSALIHEIAHANDWESDSQLTPDQRIGLLWEVTRRLVAEDRFRSENVEKDVYVGDQKRENYRKAVEYWAEISAAYFRAPGQLSIEDFILIDAYVLKNDPNFHESRSFAVIEYLRDSSDANRERVLKFDEHHSQR